ncbi:MAG: acetyltransferase [Candidatus Marsarchaeota archaeon]|nr:acetyltransferase [Candidatus Marsarchaeota archaeon]
MSLNAGGICVIFGGGGHAKVLIESLRAGNSTLSFVILDRDASRWGQQILDVAILGDDSVLPELIAKDARFFVAAVGGVGDNGPRKLLFERGISMGLEPLTIKHPASICSRWAEIGPGCQLLPGSIVNPGAVLGRNVIVNSGAIVEHDCKIGDHVHVASGAVLASTVTVGAGAHIGCGAAIRQLISVGEGATVGAGAVVVEDVPPHTLVVGVPARQP